MYFQNYVVIIISYIKTNFVPHKKLFIDDLLAFSISVQTKQLQAS